MSLLPAPRFAFVIRLALSLGVAFHASGAAAATLRADGGGGSIRVGETRSVNLVLELAPGETASVFEGAFQLSGTDSADAVFTAGSANWSSSVGKLASTGKVSLSLTSGNAGGSRVIGTLLLTGKRLGNLSVQTQGPSIVAQDTSAAPFTRDVALATAAGSTLASINVVTDVVGAAAPSMTATWLAVLCGALSLSGFAVLRRVKHA